MTTNHQTHKKTRILFLQLEFPCWEQARSWGYPHHFGIEEGLLANQAEVLVIPAMHDTPSAGVTSWLNRARDLCRGKTFDQVWLTMVHVPYEESFLDWVASLAPVRVGCLLESLSYTAEETAQNPLLATRREYVLGQMRTLTHVVCADECDAEMIESNRRARAIWWPTMVPRRLVSDHYQRPEIKQAAFFGSLYSAERKQYAQLPELQKLLVLPEAPERATNFPATFDELHRLIFSYLSTAQVTEEDVFRQYGDTLRRVRRGAFDAWMTGLKKWGGLVNLPSFGKVYTSRVCEAMGAGVPVLSWDVPDRPRNRALFEPDREILLFQRDQPAQLAEHIRHLQNDPQFARRLTKHARAKVLRYHTLDHRIRQTLDWIQTGCQPDFGDGHVVASSQPPPAPAEVAPITPVAPLAQKRTAAASTHASSSSHDGFYVDMFVKDPAWSSPQPNTDENSRWAKISAFLDLIQARSAEQGHTALRILDVGCGRGWLTNLASKYGTCQGVEPVAAVVEHARRLFPNIQFHAGTLQTVLDQPGFQPFDIVLTSEVIEHVPDAEKPGFIARIRQALRPGGFVVLTTPRKEVQAVLQREQAQSNQPVEQWLSEDDIRGLFIGNGFSTLGNTRLNYNLRTAAYLPELAEAGTENPDVIGLYQIWAFESIPVQESNANPRVRPGQEGAPSSAEAARPAAAPVKTTVFILTVGDITFEKCQEALARQTHSNFKLDIIRNVSPFSAAAQEMIRRCDTEYFIQVDEDMILYPHAVERMEAIMDSAPDDVGMICFFLYDEDRETNIQGIKIHRTRPMKGVSFKNLKASEMDLLEQMGRRGIQWVAHPDVMGRHGTLYSVETIYHRYKSMYEKDIRTWNLLTWDIRKKAGKYAQTGDPLQLFALLGAAHGIINAPLAPDAEKDFKQYNLKSLSLLKQLLTTDTPYTIPYEPSRAPKGSGSSPIPFERVRWKQPAQAAKTSDLAGAAPSAPAPTAGPKPALKRDPRLSILHTVEFYAPHTGGAEIVVQELSQRLAKRGHRVTVATTAMSERTCSELNGVEIKGFAVQGKLAEGIRGDAASYQQFLRGHPAEVMMNYAAQQWATDLAFDTLRDTRGRRVNILAPCGYSALVDPRTLRWPQFKAYFEKVLPAVLPLYDAAVYHSGMYKDFEFGRNLGLRNGLVIPNGTDDEEFSRPPSINFREKYGVTTPFIGLCVANFYSGKGQERVIECARAMGRSDFTLVFIGKEGGDLDTLRQRAAGLNVRFLVDVPRADTVAAFHAAHLFLFGSHIEASPLVIIEAKAARLPFISTDCGNVREWRGGVVCAPGEMAGHANRLLNAEGARKQLAEDGWREWKEKLTWDAVVDQWEDLYLRLHHANCQPERQPEPCAASAPEFSGPEYEISRGLSPMPVRTPPAQRLTAKPDRSDGVCGIVFSKDRPLQLDATLRSFFRHCQDPADVRLKVLYAVSDAAIGNSYAALAREYPAVEWVVERDFKTDLLRLVEDSESVLFLVDDNLFVRDFSVADAVGALLRNPRALGFSLRLGKNTTSCYSLNQAQRTPAFAALEKELLCYDWTTAEADFAYPIEVSSSIYRLSDLRPLLAGLDYRNPNTLEGVLSTNAVRFHATHPLLLCPPLSLAFCAPVNKVQRECDNRAGKQSDMSVPALAGLYAAGSRVDVAAYDGFTPNACHQEVELRLVRRESNPPRVSVVIPCFNQAHLLPEAVASVLAQTFTDWEIIIVNDGSPDDTASAAERLVQQNPGRRICLLSQVNQGLAMARNNGIRAARGKYILPLDADDCLEPLMLQKTVAVLDREPETHIVYTDLLRFGDGTGVFQTGGWTLAKVAGVNQLNYCSLYRREVWERVQGYNPNLTWGYEDWDFWIGAAERGFHARHVPEPLFRYRIKAGSMLTRAMEHDAELRARIVLNHPGLYGSDYARWAQGVLPDAKPNPLPLSSAERAQAELVISTACEQAGAGNGATAQTLIRESMSLLLRDADFAHLAGLQLWQQRQLDDAQTAFARAAELSPILLEPRLLRIGVLVDLGRMEEAETAAREVLRIDDTNVEALKLLAGLMANREQYDEAARLYYQVLQQNPADVGMLLAMSDCFIGVRDLESARLTCEQVLALAPGNEQATATLARLAGLREKPARGANGSEIEQGQSTKALLPASSPAVSVVIPCYNQAEYLPEAVQSVLEQTYQDFEVIIVNDGSPDATGEVARQLADKHSAHTIVILTRPNGGLADARNAGIRAARGRYILPLDADDKLAPDFLRETVDLLDRQPEIAVAYTDLQCFEGSTEVITKGEFGRNLMLENRVAYCSLYRRELWEAVGGYNPNMSVGYEDWDFWVGAVERGFQGQRIPQTLLRYRVKAQSMVGQAMKRHRELIARLVLNHPQSYDEPSRNRAAELLAQYPLPERDARAPGISVVIPCWDQAKYLPEAVESVRQQTFSDWEIVIVNDGSPDDTTEVATRLAAEGAGRVTLLEKPNGGLSSARNAGIRAAAGAYAFVLDADDRIRPTMLERTKAALDAREQVGFAYSHIQHFGDLDTVYPLPDFDRATLISRDNNVCGNALIRKSMWRQVGGYDETMREGYEDWNFWLSCVEKGWEGQCIHEPLFCYRKHGQTMLADANAKRERLLARLIQNHPKLYDAPTRAWAVEVLGRVAGGAGAQSPGSADRTPATGTSVPEPLAAAPKLAPPGPAAPSHEVPPAEVTVTGSVSTQPRLRVCYLISSILGVTGGNQTLLKQADALQQRGHEVTIVTYTPKPDWFKFNTRVIQVPAQQPMALFVPPCDVVISTYFSNTPELRAAKAPVKVYYAQGDQFIFADSDMPDTPENRHWKELSRASYLQTGMRFVPNSHNLARTVERRYGRKADAILPVCTDQTVFRPLQRSVPGSKFRILIVGPDTRGTQMEPLLFKGIQDIHDGLKLLAERYPHFTAVRMSATGPEIFARFPCEFYIAPDDETKTMLYGTSHLLIYASHYDSCPRPPQEAMAAGCAVICTSTPGAMEYCRDQENSLLIPLRSPQAIADATERLVKDPPLRDRLVQGGLATAREYPREREWDELEALLYRFMEEARRPVPPKHADRKAIAPSGSASAQAAPPQGPSTRPGAVVLPPAGQLGWLKNASELLQRKQLRKAWDAACEAVRVRPFHPEGVLLLGEIARAAGNPRLARRCGEQAQKLAPKWKPARKFMNGLGGKGQGNPLDWPFPSQSGPDSQSRLTVCVIARNEEKFIERCLASAKDVAFEIVVVDTGSTDRTVAIAQEQGAKVSHFTWTDDFSAARNAALEHATGDWILFLDADEELAPGARETLLKEMAAPNVMAYRLPLVDVGREDEGRSYVPRLFRNAPGLFYVGRIHEQVFTSVLVRSQEWGLTIELGQTGLLHYGYTVEMVQSRDKISRNLRLLRQAVEELPNEPNLLMNLGLELTRSGEVAQGIDYYLKARDLMSEQNPKEVPPELREVLLTQLSAHLMGAKRFPEVVSVLNSPLARAGGLTASQHFALGLALMELGRHSDAVSQFRDCLAKRDSLALTPINREIRAGAPSHCLANCLARAGDPAAAEKAFQDALKQSPKSRGVRFDYARFLASRDRQVEAFNWLHQLVSEKSDDLAAWVQGGLIALSKPEYTEFAGDWTSEALRQFPEHPVILAQRAEALLLNQDAEGALGLWRQTQSEDQASQLAAMLLCHLLTDGALRPVATELEPRVSERFLRWYQRLVLCGASKLVWLLHERMEKLAPVLPTAAKALEAVLAEAGCAPAPQ